MRLAAFTFLIPGRSRSESKQQRGPGPSQSKGTED